jgi:hypothetical protein
MAKKNIFEKLGLIEAINEKESDLDESSVENEREEFLENLSGEPNEDFEKNAKGIEDKLDVLIGAYEKNKLLTVDEIYRNSRLETDTKKTIFMADVFLKALPENLPVDVKKESLLNIMKVSNISPDTLLTDAYQRIDSLNTVLENTVQSTQTIVQGNQASIKELEKRISELNKITEERRKFEEDQNTLIEYEIQKIISIVDYIKQ